MSDKKSPKPLKVNLSKVYKSTKANEAKLKNYLQNVKRLDNR